MRGADEASRLLLLHQRLGGKLEDLLAPTRRLHLMLDVRLAAERAAPRRAVVAVLSDALLLARPRKRLKRLSLARGDKAKAKEQELAP